jgi:2-oxoglutarate ferredoxin oxidoreductase subunit delta
MEVKGMAIKTIGKHCKGCGVCVTFCPKQVLGLDALGKITVVDETKCITCKQCEMRCPDYAIFVEKK